MTDIIQVYADGSFDAASRSGSWAIVAIKGDAQIHVASGTTSGSSNNKFEVLSVMRAASWLEAESSHLAAVIWTDSAHVVEGCCRWRFIWRGNGWKRVRSNPHERRRSIPDADVWHELDGLLERNPQIKVQLCKGHSGIPGNDQADAAARLALGLV
jgi:ribonuclease HI